MSTSFQRAFDDHGEGLEHPSCGHGGNTEDHRPSQQEEGGLEQVVRVLEQNDPDSGRAHLIPFAGTQNEPRHNEENVRDQEPKPLVRREALHTFNDSAQAQPPERDVKCNDDIRAS